MNNKSQGSVATRLWYGGLFSYHFTMNLSFSLVAKEVLKSVNNKWSYGQKGCLSHVPCLPCNFLIKMQNSSGGLSVTDRNCYCLTCLCYVGRQINNSDQYKQM